MEHIFVQNKTKILSLLKRIQGKVNNQNIVVLIEVFEETEKCLNWLQQEVEDDRELITDNIVVKTIEECRGREFPVLMTITQEGVRNIGSNIQSSVIDTLTRVTSSLSIIHMERKYHSRVSAGLTDALEKELAQKAVEYEEHAYSLLKRVYLYISGLFRGVQWSFSFTD